MGKAKRLRKKQAKLQTTPATSQPSDSKSWLWAGLVVVVVIVVVFIWKGQDVQNDESLHNGPSGISFVSEGGSLKNILLITLDTTRADRFGCYGYEDIETPVLDYLSEHGVTFDQAYAPVPITLPSHASLLTGAYPPGHGVRNNGSYQLAQEQWTLAEELQQRGMRTGAFISAFVLDSQFGLDQGFEFYHDDLGKGKAEDDILEIRMRHAEQTAQEALAWIDSLEGASFFSWVHFFDAHQPYKAPAPFDVLYASNLYDGEIAYMDKILGDFFDALEARGILKDTLIVITADHGESLNEHSEETHGYFLYNATTRVPLIFFHPESIDTAWRPQGTVSLTDVAPTLLDLFGFPIPNSMQGRSLKPALLSQKDEIGKAYLETVLPKEAYGWAPLSGLVEGPWKYIRAPREELYHLKNDPGETQNLWWNDKETGREMSEKYDAFIEVLALGANAEGSRRDMTDADIEKLKSLGYVFGQGESRNTELDPKDMVPAFDRLGKIEDAHAHMRFQETESDIRWILEKHPENLKALAYLGRFLEETGRPSEAYDAFSKAISLNPHFTPALVGMGYHLVRQGKLDEAIGYYQKAIEFRKDQNADAFLQLAGCYEQKKEIEKATKVLLEAVKVNPYASRIYNNLGALYMNTRKNAEAEAYFRKALELNPNDVMVRQNLNRLLVDSGREPEGGLSF